MPCHRCEKSARESRNSHHFNTQRDNIHARVYDTCVDQRGFVTSICSKNRKIVPYHGSARVPRLTVSVPDYGSWQYQKNIFLPPSPMDCKLFQDPPNFPQIYFRAPPPPPPPSPLLQPQPIKRIIIYLVESNS